MSPITLVARDALPSSGVYRRLAIAGIVLAGVLVVGLFLWLLVHWYHHRMSEQRSEKRGAAFLHVRGVVRAGEWTASSIPNHQNAPTFNRERLTISVAPPEKTVTHNIGPVSEPSNRAAIPSPRSPTPQNANTASGSHAQPLIPRPILPYIRRSQESADPISPPLHPPPGLWSRPTSSASSMSSSQARSVRQLFKPVLPDELPLTRVGEYLNVLESFEDGWCLVIREIWRARRSSFASMLSFLDRDRQIANSSNQLHIGVVPAWVFVKPLKGLTVERPIRSSSVNVLQLGVNAPHLWRGSIPNLPK